jgi:hypothetical protein
MQYGSYTNLSDDGMDIQVWENQGAIDTHLRMGEQSKIQSIITSPWVMRWVAMPATYAAYRELRKDPTIALARAISVAPVICAEWSVRSKPGTSKEWEDKIANEYLPLRQEFVERSMLGKIDYGYAGFEQIFRYDEERQEICLDRLKNLLVDITQILIAPTGAFWGFAQPYVVLSVQNSLLIHFDVEGSQWYGMPQMEYPRHAVEEWFNANLAARYYDKKVSGGSIEVQHPIGTGIDDNGNIVDYQGQAILVGRQIEAGGVYTLPNVSGLTDDRGQAIPGFQVNFKAPPGGSQIDFTPRLEYLDKCKIRAMLFPERALIEGSHGTLAEAEAHGDLALMVQDYRHRHITALLNRNSVDVVLTTNYGPKAKGAVWLEPSPIVDQNKGFLREVYKALLANPQAVLEMFPEVDHKSLAEQLGVPGENDTAQSALPVATPTVEPGDLPPNSPVAAAIRGIYRELGIDKRQGVKASKTPQEERLEPYRLDGGAADLPPALGLPDVRQDSDFSCGAAAAMSVGLFFGVGPATLPEWEKALGTTAEHSTSARAIFEYLTLLGLEVIGRGGLTIADLIEVVRQRKVAICPIDDYHGEQDPKAADDYGHWVAVDAVDEEFVIVQDPALENLERAPGGDVPASQADPSGNIAAPGKKPILFREWMRDWHDTGLEGEAYDQFAIIVGRPAGTTLD